MDTGWSGMNDLINRQDAINELYNINPSEDMLFIDAIVDMLENLPEKSKQKWIPVSEALPKNDDWVIVSIYDNDGDTLWQYTTPGFYVPYGKCWIVDNEYCGNVIAWMPLPESYKGDYDEND